MRASSSSEGSPEGEPLASEWDWVRGWAAAGDAEGPASSAASSGRRARGWGLVGACRRMMTAGLDEDAADAMPGARGRAA